MKHDNATTHQDGLSTIAIVIIAAVVIGGGAVIATSGNNDDTTTSTATTTQSATSEAASSATFSCADGQQLTTTFTSDSEAEVTLPSGEMKTVSRVEAASGATYVSADDSFTLHSEGETVTVEQDGEVLVEGCVMTESSAAAQTQLDGDSATNAETDTDTDAAATISTEAETDTDVNVEAEVQGSAETSY